MIPFIILLLILTSLLLFVYTGPKLPADTNKIIEEVQSSPIKEYSDGKNGYAKNGHISIYYECIGENKKGVVLLVNGHSSTLLDWRKYIYQPLVDAGYQVVRYDNRGVGKSDWMENWDKKNAYTLEHMAKDGLAVLDHLGIHKVHVVGMSMGGMIAQRKAISHPERILSLTSIMSTGFYYDPELVNVPGKFLLNFFRYYFRYSLQRTEVNIMKMHLGIRKQLEGKGDYRMDTKEILEKAFYEIRQRKGYNPNVRIQHTSAIRLSDSRYSELGNINIPALIVHGIDDPLVKIEHAKKYAPLIPDAKTLYIKGMGHDLPQKYLGKILDAMLNQFAEADKATSNRMIDNTSNKF